jgi:hypothetical protein
LYLGKIDWVQVKKLLSSSYALIAPKRLVEGDIEDQ